MVPEEEAPEKEAAAWDNRAEELASWALQTLVNRRDVFGGQYVDTLGVIQRITRYGGLTEEQLVDHFAALITSDVIGLHATSPEETCRWAGIDIDNHDGQRDSAEANLRFASDVRRRAHAAGLDVRLVDSSGDRGGLHIWTVFDRPIPMADAHRLAQCLVRDWAEHGLPRRPDLFPGNVHLTGKLCGNWLRLPGRHHKRPAWAAVWSPRRRAWRRGDEAIDVLLTLRGKPVDVAAIVPADFTFAKKKGPMTARPKLPESTSTPVKSTSPIASRPVHRGKRGQAEREIRQASEALKFYRNADLEYDDWLAIGMALRNLEDEATGFELWDEWSLSSDKYDAELTAAKWASFRQAETEGDIGLGTLFRRAMDMGWPGPSFQSAEDALGTRRMTHRSGRRGQIVIPARKVVASRPDQ